MLKIIVICGGPSSEHQVSLKSGAMVFANLDRRKYRVEKVVIDKNLNWHFELTNKNLTRTTGQALDFLQQQKYHLAFLALHGAFGEDGRIQSLLESINLKYTGSGVTASAVAMNKAVANCLFASAGLLVPKYAAIKETDDYLKILKSRGLRVPLVVKPVCGGSSFGTFIVKKQDELSKRIKQAFKFGAELIIQQFVSGREVTCGVLATGKNKTIALPPTEIIPKLGQWFDYKSKYTVGGSQEITPARLSKSQSKTIQDYALRAHQALNCSGYSRSDFILANNKFYILETNTLPGMTQTSLLPQGAAAVGISFPKLLGLMINDGLRR